MYRRIDFFKSITTTVATAEHGLLEQIKPIFHIHVQYDQDPRLQTLMEDSVSLLKDVQQKKFLTSPWRFLVWKGTKEWDVC